MSGITYTVPSKINLYLRLSGKRPDGFNNLCTVFQKISLSDTLKARKIPRGCRITVHGEKPPCSLRENLLYKAYRLLKTKRRFTGGVSFDLTKNIPHGAGLGGASADCAYALRAINDLYALNIDKQELMEIGSALGSDVPLFLQPYNTALGIGRGDLLINLGNKPRFWVLLVIFSRRLSTRAVFSNVKYSKDFQLNLTKTKREVIMLTQFLSDRRIMSRPGLLKNDLEPVAFSLMPEISEVLKKLKKIKNCACLMTGSGSTVFGLFTDKHEARQAQKALVSYSCIDSLVVCQTLH
jgi:4-diphosphocytidyl-2-C-methyl-D-erythritol kinase